MCTSVDAVFVVVVQGILLHVLSSELSFVALLVVGKIECLIRPGLVEGAFVASFLGRLLQLVCDIDKSSIKRIIFAISLCFTWLHYS